MSRWNSPTKSVGCFPSTLPFITHCSIVLWAPFAPAGRKLFSLFFLTKLVKPILLCLLSMGNVSFASHLRKKLASVVIQGSVRIRKECNFTSVRGRCSWPFSCASAPTTSCDHCGRRLVCLRILICCNQFVIWCLFSRSRNHGSIGSSLKYPSTRVPLSVILQV